MGMLKIKYRIIWSPKAYRVLVWTVYFFGSKKRKSSIKAEKIKEKKREGILVRLIFKFYFGDWYAPEQVT